MMNMDKYKRNYKFKSAESDTDGRRNRIIIIVGVVLVAALAYFLG